MACPRPSLPGTIQFAQPSDGTFGFVWPIGIEITVFGARYRLKQQDLRFDDTQTKLSQAGKPWKQMKAGLPNGRANRSLSLHHAEGLLCLGHGDRQLGLRTLHHLRLLMNPRVFKGIQ